MSLFNGSYLDDEQIWSRLEKLEKEEDELKQRLARPEISSDPDKIAKLSKKLDELKQISSLARKLRSAISDLAAAEELTDQEGNSEAEALVDEYRKQRDRVSSQLFQLLINQGYLTEENEDELDIEILKYIHAWGPEYILMLAQKLQTGVPEIRDRVETLIQKGLLKRVQGTMLESYHRQEGWDKHMNHTYYNLSRKGELYLRDLRNDHENIDTIF